MRTGYGKPWYIKLRKQSALIFCGKQVNVTVRSVLSGTIEMCVLLVKKHLTFNRLLLQMEIRTILIWAYEMFIVLDCKRSRLKEDLFFNKCGVSNWCRNTPLPQPNTTHPNVPQRTPNYLTPYDVHGWRAQTGVLSMTSCILQLSSSLRTIGSCTAEVPAQGPLGILQTSELCSTIHHCSFIAQKHKLLHVTERWGFKGN